MQSVRDFFALLYLHGEAIVLNNEFPKLLAFIFVVALAITAVWAIARVLRPSHKVALAFLLLGVAMIASPAFAQPTEAFPDFAKNINAAKAKAKAALSGTATSAAKGPTDALADLMAKIEALETKFVTGAITDIQAADKDASAVNPATGQMNDAISHACYPALVQFLQSLPTATPLTGDFIGVQLFQRKRDFVAQIKAGLPTYLKLGCAALLGDEVQILMSALSLVGIKVGAATIAGLFPAAAPLALPVLAIP